MSCSQILRRVHERDCPGMRRFFRCEQAGFSTALDRRPLARIQSIVFLVLLSLSAATIAPQPALAQDSGDLPVSLGAARQLIKDLRKDLQALRKHRNTDLKSLASMRSKVEEADKEVERLNALVEFTKTQFAATKRKLQSSASQLDSLARVTNKDVAEVAQLKARLAAAMRANQMHKKRIASFARSEQVREAAVKAVAKLRSAKNAQDQQVRHLAGQVAKASAAQADELRKDLETANGKIRTLEADRENEESRTADAEVPRSQLQKAEQRIASLTEGSQGSADQVAMLKRELQQAQSKLATLADTQQSLAELSAAKAPSSMRRWLRPTPPRSHPRPRPPACAVN